MSTEVQKKDDHVSEWGLAVLSAAYLFSPIDLIPDIPIVGWVDDFFVATVGGLNLLQGYAADSSRNLAAILKMIKWAVIILGVICILLVVLLGALIVKLFTN